MNYFLNFAKNIYTQNGEDGIIEHLFELLSISEGVVVEFGAVDGVMISNTYNLWKNKNFNAILIEPNISYFTELQKNTERCANVEILNVPVNPIKNDVNSLDSILSRSKFDMNDYALCSIDVDSVDYQIFESIEKYLPKVLLVEREAGSKIEDDFYTSRGCSLLALMKLGERKGYTCVCDTLNAIFVRNDLMHLLPKEDYSIEKLFVPLSYIQNTLQCLDSEGTVDTTPYWSSSFYKNKIENEKKYLRSL